MRIEACRKAKAHILTVVWFSVAVALSYFLYMTAHEPEHGDPPLKTFDDEEFAIKTSGCKIPKLDPWHPHVMPFIKYHPDLKCIVKPLALKFDGRTIKITEDGTKIFGFLNCSLRAVYFKDDKTFKLGRASYFDKKIKTTKEFSKISCRNKSNSVVYTEFYPIIKKNKKTEERVKYSAISHQLKNEHVFSILLLGLDAVSKSHFLRHMQRTYKFIKSNFVYAELRGINRIGRNTYPTMTPFLTGHMSEEVVDTQKEPADMLPLIWHQFETQGYRTLFSEDEPEYAIFSCTRTGFSVKPTDYYLRPFSLAMEPFVNGTKTKRWERGCVNDRPESELILRWMEDFIDTFPKDPLFSFTYLTRMSHDSIEDLGYHDKPISKFLGRLKKKPSLNNTIFFFFSDHGYRNGGIRRTFTGRMEGKLPFMFIIVPRWFPDKYPQLYANLKVNERRLTTALDMYATLQDLLNFKGEGKEEIGKGRSISVLRYQIPENRTCKDANIRGRFCACFQVKPIPVKNNTQVEKSAQEIVDTINNITLPKRSVCAKVSLEIIMDASQQEVSLGEKWKYDGAATYVVTVKVKPSGGIFEGRVWYNGLKTYTVESGIERISIYGNQSHCVKSGQLKPYCYCKNKKFTKFAKV